ncbi:hypothetical protein EIKCOROL_00106 [Eikenella corrodens ATCC 23834]|uniref:Uncharacterized protein n=1 Tax=Eikenella corrodens ATCC 23834 TaxID=546274 RepID=C0DRZ0_EIKCO|nr:hypothetical protein EIKCOROL_00106 [Eikenella corrodens ATCC 23834]
MQNPLSGSLYNREQLNLLHSLHHEIPTLHPAHIPSRRLLQPIRNHTASPLCARTCTEHCLHPRSRSNARRR